MKKGSCFLLYLIVMSSLPVFAQEWTAFESKHFLFYYKSNHLTEKKIEAIAGIGEDAYDFVTEFLGMRTTEKTKVYLHASREEFGIFAGGYASEGNIHIMCQRCEYDRCFKHDTSKSLRRVIAHEFVHIVMMKRMICHPLFSEGLASYVAVMYVGEDPHEYTKFLHDNDALVPLEVLLRNFGYYNGTVSYEEAMSFSAFLMEEYGIDKYKQFVSKDIENSEQLKENIKSIFYASLDDLESNWIESIEELPSSGIVYKNLYTLHDEINEISFQYFDLSVGDKYSAKIDDVFCNLYESYDESDFQKAEYYVGVIKSMLDSFKRGNELFSSACTVLYFENDPEIAKNKFKQASVLFTESGFLNLKHKSDVYIEAITLTQEGDLLLESNPTEAKNIYLKAQELYKNDSMMSGIVQGKAEEASRRIHEEWKKRTLMIGILVFILLLVYLVKKR